jgi:hypothetical protein
MPKGGYLTFVELTVVEIDVGALALEVLEDEEQLHMTDAADFGGQLHLAPRQIRFAQNTGHVQAVDVVALVLQ